MRFAKLRRRFFNRAENEPFTPYVTVGRVYEIEETDSPWTPWDAELIVNDCNFELNVALGQMNMVFVNRVPVMNDEIEEVTK